MPATIHPRFRSSVVVATTGLALFAVSNFSLPDHAQTFDKLYDFTAASSELRHPVGGFAQASDGTLYATTAGSLPNDRFVGALFSFVPGSDPVDLKDFISYDPQTQGREGGPVENSNVVADSDGNVYGALNPQAVSPPATDTGTIYKFGSGGYSVLHKFGGMDIEFKNTGGAIPFGRLLLASDGNIYGQTSFGGESGGGSGVLYRLSPSGDFKVIAEFNTTQLPGGPTLGGLTEAEDGSLYGITSPGTAPGGCIFRLTPDSASNTGFDLSIVKNLPFNDTVGEFPESSLLVIDGVIYGTFREEGSSGGSGTFWQVDKEGRFKLLYDFATPDRGRPGGAIIKTSDGNIWITAVGPELSYGAGAILEFSPSGALLWSHDFAFYPQAGGNVPVGSLFLAADGNLYGTTERGGVNDKGTIFEIVDP
jgi:uncharacterized repeat protein (TIGR03803 family)